MKGAVGQNSGDCERMGGAEEAGSGYVLAESVTASSKLSFGYMKNFISTLF